MTPTLEQLLDIGEGFARNTLLERGKPSLHPFYDLVTADNQHALVPCFWINDEEKDGMIAAVQQVSREVGAVAALFVSEAWLVKRSTLPSEWHRKRTIANIGKPSEQPDRIEVVQLVAMDGKHAIPRVLQIVRDKPGGKIISLILDNDAGGQFAGRMVEGIIA